MLPEQGLNAVQIQNKQGDEETLCSCKTLVLRCEVQRDFAIFFFAGWILLPYALPNMAILILSYNS